VTVFERANVCGEQRAARRNFEVRVAFGATNVATRHNVDAAAVLDVAGGAVRNVGADLIFVVRGPVVAGEASGVGGFGGELPAFCTWQAAHCFSRTAWGPLMRPLE